MKRNILFKSLCILLTVTFLVNEISYALSPAAVSDDLADGSAVREDMYATGLKAIATKHGPGAIDLQGAYQEHLMERYASDINRPFTPLETVPVDYAHLPEGWANNPILSMTDLIEALRYFAANEAKIPESLLSIEEAEFEVDEEKGELPIAQLIKKKGKYILKIHPKFVKAWNDIRAKDVWFRTRFDEGAERVTSLAWGIFYRLAKHEMADLVKETGLPKSYGHLTASVRDGSLREIADEYWTNLIDGKYAYVNDAIWMWFLGSYSFTDAVHHDDKLFACRLMWLFNEPEALRNIEFPSEFPNLTMGDVRLKAIDTARAINMAFYSDRAPGEAASSGMETAGKGIVPDLTEPDAARTAQAPTPQDVISEPKIAEPAPQNRSPKGAITEVTPLDTIFSHDKEITSVAFSPDGRHILTGSYDETARLWDLSTGECITVLKGHGGWVLSVAFSPDGTKIVTGSSDETARLWDLSTGECEVLEGHEDWVSSVAFSPDGTKIVTGSDDETARLWDLSTGECKVLESHGGSVLSVAFSPDGTKIVTGSDDGKVRLWDLSTGECITVLKGHGGWVRSVAFSPDGRHILTGSDDETARLWDVFKGNCINVFKGHGGWVRSVAFSPDGKHALTGTNDGKVRLWDLSTGECITVLKGHGGWVLSVAFSPDGTKIVTGSSDNTAQVWDVKYADVPAPEAGPTPQSRDGDIEQTLPDTTSTASPTAERVVGSATGKDYEPAQPSIPPELEGRVPSVVLDRIMEGHIGRVISVAFSSDGKTVFTGGWDGTVRIWDATTSECTKTLGIYENRFISAAFSPDKNSVIIGYYEGIARLWNISTGECIRTLTGHEGWVTSVAFSPDGKTILTGSVDRTAKLWDVSTGGCEYTLRGHEDEVVSAAFSPDGTKILTGSVDCTAKLWDVSTGGCEYTLRGHADHVTSVVFSPDGETILTGSRDHTARLWNISTGECIRTLTGHEGWVTSVAFSPDGKTILTGSADDTAKLWDVSTGECINTLVGNGGWVASVAFSPDGKNILIGCGDYKTRVWKVEYDTPAERVVGSATGKETAPEIAEPAPETTQPREGGIGRTVRSIISAVLLAGLGALMSGCSREGQGLSMVIQGLDSFPFMEYLIFPVGAIFCCAVIAWLLLIVKEMYKGRGYVPDSLVIGAAIGVVATTVFLTVLPFAIIGVLGLVAYMGIWFLCIPITFAVIVAAIIVSEEYESGVYKRVELMPSQTLGQRLDRFLAFGGIFLDTVVGVLVLTENTITQARKIIRRHFGVQEQEDAVEGGIGGAGVSDAEELTTQDGQPTQTLGQRLDKLLALGGIFLSNVSSMLVASGERIPAPDLTTPSDEAPAGQAPLEPEPAPTSAEDDIIKIISEYIVRLGLDQGPGSTGGVVLTAAEFEAVFKSVGLLHESSIEILMPAAIGLTDSMRRTLHKIRTREGREVVRCNIYSGKKHLEQLLARQANEGLKRIVVSEPPSNDEVGALTSNDEVAALAEEKPALFRDVRLFTAQIPGQDTMDQQEKSVYQAEIITIAILVRLVEKDNKTPMVEAMLRAMVSDRLDYGAGEAGTPDDFIKGLLESDDEAADPLKTQARVRSCLGRIVKLVEKIGRELILMQAFWTAA